MSAIERIKGYCCKVNPEQWEELKRVADEVGCPVEPQSRLRGINGGAFTYAQASNGTLLTYFIAEKLIPFDSFIDKLRGGEEWKPKAGEIADFSYDAVKWWDREFIGESRGKFIGWTEAGNVAAWDYCRPARPRYTRAEAEKKFNIVITEE